MKELLLLKKNGYVKRKDETKLSLQDIHDSEYILINSSTSDESRCYVLTEPTELLLFDRAIIEYQLCIKYQEYDMDMASDDFKPVRFETSSLTDVISIINSSDKFNIVNNLLIEQWSDNAGQLGLTYLGITLFKNNKVIFDNYYELNGIDSVLYDSYQVAKKFASIYDGNIASNFRLNTKFIQFVTDNDKIRWNIVHSIPNSGMFGYPEMVSNTIIMIDAYEYTRLLHYSGNTTYFNVYFDTKKNIESITKFIQCGRYQEAFGKLDDCLDIFVDTSRCLYKNPRDVSMTLALLCNLEFVFRTANTIYDVLYNYKDILLFKDADGNHTHDFDCVLAISFRKQSKEIKEIVFNKDNILYASEIFSIL